MEQENLQEIKDNFYKLKYFLYGKDDVVGNQKRTDKFRSNTENVARTNEQQRLRRLENREAENKKTRDRYSTPEGKARKAEISKKYYENKKIRLSEQIKQMLGNG